MYCNQCGFENRTDAKFCRKCGSALTEQNVPHEEPVQSPIFKAENPELAPISALPDIVKTKSDGKRKLNKLILMIAGCAVVLAIGLAGVFIIPKLLHTDEPAIVSSPDQSTQQTTAVTSGSATKTNENYDLMPLEIGKGTKLAQFLGLNPLASVSFTEQEDNFNTKLLMILLTMDFDHPDAEKDIGTAYKAERIEQDFYNYFGHVITDGDRKKMDESVFYVDGYYCLPPAGYGVSFAEIEVTKITPIEGEKYRIDAIATSTVFDDEANKEKTVSSPATYIIKLDSSSKWGCFLLAQQTDLPGSGF